MGNLIGKNFKFVVITAAFIGFLIYAIASGSTITRFKLGGLVEIELAAPKPTEQAPPRLSSTTASPTATPPPTRPAEPSPSTVATVVTPDPTPVPPSPIPTPGIIDLSGRWIYPGGFWEFTKSEDGFQFKEFEDNTAFPVEDNTAFPVSEGSAYLVEGGGLAIIARNCDAKYGYYWQGPVTGNRIKATFEHTPGTMISFELVKESEQTGSSPEPAPSREVVATPSPLVMTDISGRWIHPGGYWEFKNGGCEYIFEEFEGNNPFPVSEGSANLKEGGELAITTWNPALDLSFYWQVRISGNQIRAKIEKTPGDVVDLALERQTTGQ